MVESSNNNKKLIHELNKKIESLEFIIEKKNNELFIQKTNENNNNNFNTNMMHEKTKLIENKDETIISLKKELDNKDETIISLKKELDNKEKVINNKKNEIHSLENEVQKIKNAVTCDKSIEIIKLKTEIESNISVYDEIISRLKSELVDKKKTIKKINEIILNNNEYFKKINDDLREKEEKIIELTKKSKKDLEKNSNEIELLKMNITTMKDELCLANNSYIIQSNTYN